MQTKQNLNLNPLIVGLVACALTLALIALAMPVLETSAQTATATPSAATKAVTSTVQGAKVLRIGDDIFPDVLDPQKASFVNEMAALSLVYEGLATIDANGEAHPAASDRYVVSSDGLSVTIHIRDGLKRADGTPITAKDFEYALKRAVDPRVLGKQYVSLLFDIKGAQALAELDPEKATEAQIAKAFEEYGVKAVDASNLNLTFNRPVASYWVYIASMPIFFPTDAKAADKDPENWWKTPANHNGNGPFMFKEIDATNGKIVVVPNPNYWQGKAKLDRIEFSYNPDNEANLKAYEEGKLDIDSSVTAELVPEIISNTKIISDFLHYPSAQTVALAFNNTRKPFDDRNVRIAFSQALDRFGFVRDELDSVGTPYTRWIPPDVLGNQSGEPGVPDSDPSSAVNTLVNNGYAAKDSTAAKPKVDCEKLGEIKFTYPDSPINQKRVEYIINNLTKVFGCPIIADPVAGTEFTSLTKDVRTNPQLSIQRWVQDYPHPQNWLTTYWACGAFSRRYGYCNLFLDQILKQADATADIEDALPLYQQAEDLLIQDVPGAFMYNPENLQLVKPYLLGPKDNLSSQDAGWAGQYGPVWQYDIDLTQVPATYPKQ